VSYEPILALEMNTTMAFRMAEGSLFALLLRSSWWISVCIALAIITLSLAIAEAQFLILGIAGALPFLGIAAYAGYQQYQRPSRKRIQEVAMEAKTMRADQLAKKIAARYIEKRFDCKTLKGGEANLELSRGHEKILLNSKRFKVANTGIDPLKKLVEAGEKGEATGYLHVALGTVSKAAIDFAKHNNIEIIQADRLAEFFDGQAQID